MKKAYINLPKLIPENKEDYIRLNNNSSFKEYVKPDIMMITNTSIWRYIIDKVSFAKAQQLVYQEYTGSCTPAGVQNVLSALSKFKIKISCDHNRYIIEELYLIREVLKHLCNIELYVPKYIKYTTGTLFIGQTFDALDRLLNPNHQLICVSEKDALILLKSENHILINYPIACATITLLSNLDIPPEVRLETDCKFIKPLIQGYETRMFYYIVDCPYYLGYYLPKICVEKIRPIDILWRRTSFLLQYLDATYSGNYTPIRHSYVKSFKQLFPRFDEIIEATQDPEASVWVRNHFVGTFGELNKQYKTQVYPFSKYRRVTLFETFMLMSWLCCNNDDIKEIPDDIKPFLEEQQQYNLLHSITKICKYIYKTQQRVEDLPPIPEWFYKIEYFSEVYNQNNSSEISESEESIRESSDESLEGSSGSNSDSSSSNNSSEKQKIEQQKQEINKLNSEISQYKELIGKYQQINESLENQVKQFQDYFSRYGKFTDDDKDFQ